MIGAGQLVAHDDITGPADGGGVLGLAPGDRRLQVVRLEDLLRSL